LRRPGPTGAISVSFRIFPDHVEVDVLKSGAQIGAAAGIDALASLVRAHEAAGGIRQAAVADGSGAAGPLSGVAVAEDAVADSTDRQEAADADAESFADWMAGVLRREGLTMEAAARPARRVGEDREPLGRRCHRAPAARPAADPRAVRRDPVHLSASC
jgi:hypothetical protein